MYKVIEKVYEDRKEYTACLNTPIHYESLIKGVFCYYSIGSEVRDELGSKIFSSKEEMEKVIDEFHSRLMKQLNGSCTSYDYNPKMI